MLDRFSAGRMTDGYEAIYRTMLGLAGSIDGAAGSGTGEEAASPRLGDGEQVAEPRPLKPVMSRIAAAGIADHRNKMCSTILAVQKSGHP